MPFGLTNSPAVFQRWSNFPNKHTIPNILVYMDNIVIGYRSIDEGIDKLIKVLGMLRVAYLSPNLKKCIFFRKTIEISSLEVRPGVHNTEAGLAFPSPRNPHDVRQFIALAVFFESSFVTSQLYRSLTNLT